MPGTEAAFDPAQRENAARRHALEVEVRVLRDRLAQRDAVLAKLNHRLLELERGDFSVASPTDARLQALRQELQTATQRVTELESALAHTAGVERELTAMRQTKLFRWSAPLRALYGAMGGGRR